MNVSLPLINDKSQKTKEPYIKEIKNIKINQRGKLEHRNVIADARNWMDQIAMEYGIPYDKGTGIQSIRLLKNVQIQK